jgi:hypothetical protein
VIIAITILNAVKAKEIERPSSEGSGADKGDLDRRRPKW